MTLDEQLRALCEQHNCHAISIGINVVTETNPREFFTSYAHGNDGEIGSTTHIGGSDVTPRGAIGSALDDLAARRSAKAVVPALEAA